MKPTVLVAGCDAAMVQLFTFALNSDGFAATASDDLHLTAEKVALYDVTVLTDFYSWGNAPGLELAVKLYKAGANLILTTVYAMQEKALSAVLSANVPVLFQPLNIKDLVIAVHQKLETA